MYAVIRRYTFTGQGMAEFVKEKGDDLRKTMAKPPGFKSYCMVLADATLATITMCDDAAGAAASNRIAADWVKANMPASIQMSAPETTEGEVAISS